MFSAVGNNKDGGENTTMVSRENETKQHKNSDINNKPQAA
jgi:hypothetical protein